MKNFTKKIRRNSILVLLCLFSVFFVLSVSITMSKYVIEKPVGNITLNVPGVDVLLPGLQFRKAMGTSVTEVVFGRTKDYVSEIDGIEPINVDVKGTGKIKLYVNGTKAYILSDRKIYANPDSYQMFFDLKNLIAVDFSNFDTGIVTDMRHMFRGCTKLTTIDVSLWNTGNVEDMEFLFRDCSSLVSLDLSRWNTAKVKKLYGAFYECKGLTSLDVSKWNTSAVTNIDVAFFKCASLTSLDLSRWKTAKVENLYGTFYECKGLTSLDLSSWNTSLVTYMSHMFYNCGELASIYVGSGWNTDKVYYAGNMFKQCKKLSGGKGTAYDDAHTNQTYARIDGGTANPGYFTDIADKP